MCSIRLEGEFKMTASDERGSDLFPRTRGAFRPLERCCWQRCRQLGAGLRRRTL